MVQKSNSLHVYNLDMGKILSLVIFQPISLMLGLVSQISLLYEMIYVDCKFTETAVHSR